MVFCEPSFELVFLKVLLEDEELLEEEEEEVLVPWITDSSRKPYRGGLPSSRVATDCGRKKLRAFA